MPPAGIKSRSKRVFVEQQTIRITRSKKTTTQPDASKASSDINAPSLSNVSLFGEVGTFDGHPQATIQGARSIDAQVDDNTHLVTEGNAIMRSDGHRHMGTEDNGLVQLDDNMNNGGEAIVELGVDDQLDDEAVLLGENNRWERGVNLGRGLHRINRAMNGKLPLVIPEGKIRPVVPLVAAKFATECNIAVRNHIPVFKHWKDYKKHSALLDQFTGKIGAKFDINTRDRSVQKACSQMMKNALRQQRHRLKKQYFDPFPLHLVRKISPVRSMTDEQWNDLVECWKTQKKMETCQKNKANRTNVKYHQTTGSRSYEVYVENLGDKYNDKEPDALDLFKECHYSKKKKGFTSDVQLTIDEMENKRSMSTEDEQPCSVTQVVADVLAANTKNNRFLQNVGIQNANHRPSVKVLEAQLEMEKKANGELHEQLDLLLKQVQETEHARMREQEDMKKKQAEMEAKLPLVLNQF